MMNTTDVQRWLIYRVNFGVRSPPPFFSFWSNRFRFRGGEENYAQFRIGATTSNSALIDNHEFFFIDG